MKNDGGTIIGVIHSCLCQCSSPSGCLCGHSSWCYVHSYGKTVRGKIVNINLGGGGGGGGGNG